MLFVSGRPSDDESTAVHEAAHAVIGRVLGMVCGGASIIPDNDFYGHAIAEDPYAIMWHWEQQGKFRMPDSVFLGCIITLMAGAEAEVELAGARPQLICDGDDRGQIARLFDETFLDEDENEDRLRQLTRALVRRHRAKIETVAEALLEQKTLSEPALDALVFGEARSFRGRSACRGARGEYRPTGARLHI